LKGERTKIGLTFENLTREELCDLMCGKPEEDDMPVRKVKGGYRWGKSGKLYKGKGAKKKAAKQGRAIRASGYKG